MPTPLTRSVNSGPYCPCLYLSDQAVTKNEWMLNVDNDDECVLFCPASFTAACKNVKGSHLQDFLVLLMGSQGNSSISQMPMSLSGKLSKKIFIPQIKNYQNLKKQKIQKKTPVCLLLVYVYVFFLEHIIRSLWIMDLDLDASLIQIISALFPHKLNSVQAVISEFVLFYEHAQHYSKLLMDFKMP